MTVPRVILAILGLLALADGAVWEAVGLLALLLVLVWLVPTLTRPVPFTVTWRYGRWRDH